MLPLGRSQAHLCEGITRREWLRVGSLSAMGVSLSQLLAAGKGAAGDEAARTPNGATITTAAGFGRAKSCILCFMWGGQPHQDLYDLKPDAPLEARGECHPIASSVPGTQLGDLIPKIAARAHEFALLRSVTHPDSTHTVAMHYMMSGYRHRRPATNPMNAPDDFPCFGSVIKKLRPGTGALPSGISLNAPGLEIPLGHIFPGFFGGFLGSGYDPLFVTEDPSAPDFQALRSADGADLSQVNRRVRLLDEFDAFRRRHEFDTQVSQAQSYQTRALELLTSGAARRALDLKFEKAEMRDRYGKSAFGQGCLLARRLVEAGVKLVTVNWARIYQPKIADLWDTHANHFSLLRERLCPPFDLGLSALLDDLKERALLDETLVVVMSEFGRTPQINKNAGRDHWPGCNSVLLAGAGIRGGAVYGSSDRLAMYPDREPVQPEDLAATIYYSLGIPQDSMLQDHTGRPLPIATGRPLTQLFG